MADDRSSTPGGARTDILTGVWDLIAAGGVGGFSIRDAAAAAGVSAGTVTYYFSNRERLLEETFIALAARHNAIGAVAITSSRSGTDDTARDTLVYALHHLWGERAITLAAAELRTHAARSRAACDCADVVAGTCRRVVDELHRVTNEPRTRAAVAGVVDLLDAEAIRLAVRHQSPKTFRVAVRRHVNDLYLRS